MLRNILLIGLLVLNVGLIGCGRDAVFSGSRTGNENQFLVDFEYLNTTVESKMPLVEGETIETMIEIENGEVGIMVKNENGEVAYRGDDLEKCSYNFTIIIEDEGTYTFSITGFKAEGNVYFVKSLVF
ncbi:MAG: hypothetical protein PHH21_03730 [Candidatus Pacebacteria bacterium]|nr:hypothetical protein [Candidatus Paceibacterota bacterium]